MDLNFISEEERARRQPIVTRLATALAHQNGDSILTETYILSETTVQLSPKTEAQLAAGGTTLKDASGAHYSPYVRRDGKGQINIYRANGQETTLKFWIPEKYLTPATPPHRKAIFEVEDTSQKSTARTHPAMEVAYAHPYLFSSLALCFTFGFFLITEALQSTPNPSLPHLITAVTLSIISLFESYALRFHGFKKQLATAPAIGITGIAALGWFLATRTLLVEKHFYLWNMLIISLLAFYATLHYQSTDEKR